MNFKKIISFVVGVSLVFSLCACSSEKFSGEKKSFDVVGTVGDEKIYTSEFKYYLNLDKTQREEEAGIADKSDAEKKKFWNSKEGDIVRKQEIIDTTFKNLSELKTFLLAAKKDKVELPKQDIDNIAKSVDDFIKTEGNGNRDEAEKAMMEKNGVTLAEYQRMYEEYTLAYFNYSTTYPYKIEISDSDIKKEFESNKENYNKVVVKHVLVSTKDSATQQDLPEDKIAQKKKLAEEILEKAKSGEDFEGLVKEYSEDQGSKESGGEYTFGKGEMVSEFEKWSFSAKEGDMGMVQSSFGFHIMKFIRVATFEDLKDEIKSVLQKEQFSKNIEEIKKQYPLVKNQEAVDSLDLF